MVRESFDESFERLRNQSNHLADIERPEDSFDINGGCRAHDNPCSIDAALAQPRRTIPPLEPGETRDRHRSMDVT